MRFFYFSVFSMLLWSAYFVVVTALIWLVWTKLFNRKFTARFATISALLVAVLPWTEEFWIAYNFDSLCRKDAGVFINKVAEVDGYYNDTGTVTRIVDGPLYKFIESPDGHGKYRRVERATDEEKARALAWYSEKNPGKTLKDNEWAVQPVNDAVQVVVEQGTEFAWRVTTLDQPTARYQYKRTMASGTSVAYRITRSEDVVLDNKTGELIGRITDYGRDPYWFYISLGTPTISCEETLAGIRKYGSLIYRAVLQPSK